MINSFLYIVVPTVLILVVVILLFNSRSKRMMKEMTNIRTQLESLENKAPQAEQIQPAEEKAAAPAEEPEKEPEPEPEREEEIKDAPEETQKETEASAYNTGKSGKIYTKEELELLIKE